MWHVLFLKLHYYPSQTYYIYAVFLAYPATQNTDKQV